MEGWADLRLSESSELDDLTLKNGGADGGDRGKEGIGEGGVGPGRDFLRARRKLSWKRARLAGFASGSKVSKKRSSKRSSSHMIGKRSLAFCD